MYWTTTRNIGPEDPARPGGEAATSALVFRLSPKFYQRTPVNEYRRAQDDVTSSSARAMVTAAWAASAPLLVDPALALSSACS